MRFIFCLLLVLILPASAGTLYGGVQENVRADETVPGYVSREAEPIDSLDGTIGRGTQSGIRVQLNETAFLKSSMATTWGTPWLAGAWVDIEPMPPSGTFVWYRFFTIGHPEGPRGYMQEFYNGHGFWWYRYWLSRQGF